MCNRPATRTSLMLVLAMVASAFGQTQSPEQLWEDFNHYVRIARPDLAKSIGQTLLDKTRPAELLVIAETSPYRDWETGTLQRAQRMEGLRDLAEKISDAIEQARFARSREPDRIADDIKKLAGGARESFNARQRLRQAGQFAAPQLLATLEDAKQRDLHTSVINAVVEIGRPMVYPMAEALPQLEPVAKARVAQMLADIGYPMALPYMKAVLEDQTTAPDAMRTVQAAYTRLARSLNLSPDTPAAQQYLRLSDNYFDAATRDSQLPGYDPVTEKGIVWEYSKLAGLVAVPVPGQIYGDVLSMRAAQRALALDPQLDAAFSLWLAANARRENRLQAGEQDPSYAGRMKQPSFYLRLAGPLRLHEVLDRALDIADSSLALDAIDALADTAGTDALVNREGTAQPLLRALSYPDRRVRFEAAFALTNARPTEAFPGSFRIVPVLAEAVRQQDKGLAVVLGDDQQEVNQAMAVVEELGMTSLGDISLEGLAEQLAAGPGADIIVAVNMTAADVIDLVNRTRMDFRLNAVPVLALVTPGDQIVLNNEMGRNPRLVTSLMTLETDELRKAVEKTQRAYVGEPLTEKEAADYALEALAMLREIAMGSSAVFNVQDATGALVQALNDPRDPIVMAAGKVLAHMPDDMAQQALATAALESSRRTATRVSLLQSLAQNAINHGNQLTDALSGQLLDLVGQAEGDLAIAASQAHGALTLPTSHGVDLILGQE